MSFLIEIADDVARKIGLLSLALYSVLVETIRLFVVAFMVVAILESSHMWANAVPARHERLHSLKSPKPPKSGETPLGEFDLKSRLDRRALKFIDGELKLDDPPAAKPGVNALNNAEVRWRLF